MGHFFRDMQLGKKLTGLFLLVGLLPLFVASYMAQDVAKDALEKQAFNQLVGVREIKRAQIDKFFQEREGDLGVLLNTVDTLRGEAFNKLAAIQELKKAQMTDYIQTLKNELLILRDDPIAWNSTRELAEAFAVAGKKVGESAWDALARQYQPRFKNIMNDNGWYDIFLINTDGDIVYTVTRESDLGQSLTNSQLASSSFGKVFKQARMMGKDELAVSDFAPYAPSGGTPAAFMVSQMHDDKGLAGYIAFQMPTDHIQEIMHRRTGMGKTGESYLVGPDGLMRSDSFLDPKGHSVAAAFKNNTTVDTEATREALAGKTGQEVISDYNGNPVLSAWAPIKISDEIRWAMISEIDVAEAFSPVDDSGEAFYEKYVKLYGYYDLFLINPDGYVFYTVGKEPDYQTNMKNGKFSSSNLGKLFRNVSASKQYGFADFAPYAPSNGIPAGFIAQPLTHLGEIEVVVALQLSLGAINEIMNQREGMGDTGEAYLVGSDYRMRSDSFQDKTGGHSVKASFAGTVKANGVESVASKAAIGGEKGQGIIIDYNGNSVLSAYTSLDIAGTRWALIAEIDESEAFAAVTQLIYFMLGVAVVGAIAVFLVGFFSARSITTPVKQMLLAADDLREGDGDLTQRLPDFGKNEIGLMAVSFNGFIEKIQGVLVEIKDNLTQMVNAASQVSQTAQQLSQAASEQAASIEQTSASMEEMSASISQNTENAKVTESIAAQGAAHAVEGGTAVEETVKAMKDIAGKIGIIDDIAYKTNLLALNAAIEAARAGEHGKGFAVVASEVRKLAERSQLSSQEIATLAMTSVEVAEKAGGLLQEIVPASKKTSELVQEITAASNEQSSGATQIDSAIGQMNQVTQTNSASSEELAATAEELNGLATQLNDIMGFFKLTADDGRRRTRVAASSSKPKLQAQPKAKAGTRAQTTEEGFNEF